jgi:hypothetical protein
MECGVEVEVEVEVESDSAEDDGLRFGDGNQILWKTKVAVELRNQFLKGGRTVTWGNEAPAAGPSGARLAGL